MEIYGPALASQGFESPYLHFVVNSHLLVSMGIADSLRTCGYQKAPVGLNFGHTQGTPPVLGAKVVARAWVDPAFRQRLLADGRATCRSGFGS
jgi:hypothetical protein